MLAVNIESKTKVPWKHYTSHVLKGNYDDLTPMGTLFEDSTHLFLDGLICRIYGTFGKKEIDLKTETCNNRMIMDNIIKYYFTG